MGPTLRNKLIKRQALDNLRDSSDSSDTSSARSATTPPPPPPPEKDTPIAPDDLAQTPPLPHTMQSIDPSSAASPNRALPSKLVLNRYKHRIPLPKLIPSNEHNQQLAGKTRTDSTVECGNINHQGQRRRPSDPAPIIRLPPTIKVGGQNFVMLNDGVEEKDSGPSEGMIPRIARSIGLQPQPGRTTRSQSRRGSGSSDKESDKCNKLKREDSLEIDELQDEVTDSSTLIPAPLRNRANDSNNKTQRRASRRSSRRVAGPTDIFETELFDALHSHSRDSSPDAITVAPSKQPRNTTPTDDDLPLASYTSQDASAIHAIIVMPPLYDVTKSPLEQWTSGLRTTSRPEFVWGWTRRWTCCTCGSETIVEQRTCSFLECTHLKCSTRCRLLQRPKLGHKMFV